MTDTDDFKARHAHLTLLGDEELKQRFWNLTEKLVDPLMALARRQTSPSIERSILMRMGFSSMEANSIVLGVMERGLMGKGAGHIVFKLARERQSDIREAGLSLIDGEGWDEAVALFTEASS